MSTTFSDFEFYARHGGKLSEAEYNAVVDEAHAEIISRTNGRANSAPEDMREAVMLCECALVDIIDAYAKSAKLLPKGIGSISNDGLTVTMGSANPRQAEKQERRNACVRYLQFPVNLMCRWA